MKVFHSPSHGLHNPGNFYLWGQFIEWSPDQVARADNILETLQKDDHDILVARSHGLRPIADVHTPEYLDYLQVAWSAFREASEPARQSAMLQDRRELYPLIFPANREKARYPSSIMGRAGFHTADLWMPIVEHTWEAAAASANLAVEAADAILQGDRVVYALCRPSGHHAEMARGGGNCYLNNAAIAAQYLRRGKSRVAIIDIDVHHGNGTQQIFYDRDDVLFVSIHRDPDDCYPYYVGYGHERGEGRGHGYNLNLPLPPKSQDGPFVQAVKTACDRIEAFAPDALVVSLGVDGHEGDPTAELQISFDGFRQAGVMLGQLGLPTALIQEGGYNLETIGRCVSTVLSGFEAR